MDDIYALTTGTHIYSHIRSHHEDCHRRKPSQVGDSHPESYAKKVYILKFMVYLNQYFSCHRHYGLVGWKGSSTSDVFVIDDEFDVVRSTSRAIVQDVASRAADIDEYIDMFRRRGVHIPITHPSYAGVS
jgi:hypothetical protein